MKMAEPENKKLHEEVKYEKSKTYLMKYLSSISKANHTYKRVLISPLRYAGGKSKAIGLILNNLPMLKEKKIVSPFIGGGSFELCASQVLDIEVIAYDVFGYLVNFWNVLLNRKNEFVHALKQFKVNQNEFTYNRHVLLNHWNKIKPQTLMYKTKEQIELNDADKTLLDDNSVMQAVYYYYNMTLSYGPMFLGWPSSNEINQKKFKKKIARIEATFYKPNIHVEQADFKDVIKNHKYDFLFLDPPYFLGNDSTMFKGMYPNSNFAIHHNNFDHNELCLLLKEHKGGFFMTYNDCPTIRNMYSQYIHVFPEWQYTYGQGEKRIGKNRLDSYSNVKGSSEIFIICPT